MLVEKKLRDVTKEEFKDWVVRNCGNVSCKACPFKAVNCGAQDENNWVMNKDIFADSFLNRRMFVEQKDILDKEEKEYLRAVIKPFRDKITSIQVIYSTYYKNKGWIQIETPGIKTQLPYCDITKMYKGMEDCIQYTVEELGL